MSNAVPEKKIEPRRLKGFKDYLPALMETRARYQSLIRVQAQLAGFREIGTPALEYLETLLGQGGDETDKQLYRFEDHGGRKVGLRFDLTIPFARFIAEHQGELVFPFKRLQIGDVWRGENTQKGRYREFCQCDLDIIGVDTINADIEVITCLMRTLAQFSLGGFTMRIGNRILLSAIIRKAYPGIEASGEQQAMIALDKLDKIGASGVIGLLIKIPGSTSESADLLVSIVTNKDRAGNSDQARLADFLVGHEAALKELSRMSEILTVLKSLSGNMPGTSVQLDYSIA
ncbi:MAG: ATP phosphoribosyltransferase regulatory subunit, partial [Proteobacteria bacterium]|nr:ATP phosphoribosyltransferase regulatory subunit [Pseudomonadota bacterium]